MVFTIYPNIGLPAAFPLNQFGELRHAWVDAYYSFSLRWGCRLFSTGGNVTTMERMFPMKARLCWIQRRSVMFQENKGATIAKTQSPSASLISLLDLLLLGWATQAFGTFWHLDSLLWCVSICLRSTFNWRTRRLIQPDSAGFCRLFSCLIRRVWSHD